MPWRFPEVHLNHKPEEAEDSLHTANYAGSEAPCYLYICAYVYAHTDTYVRSVHSRYLCMHVYMRCAYIHMYMYTHAHTRLPVPIHLIYMYVYIQIDRDINNTVRPHKRTCIYIDSHIHTDMARHGCLKNGLALSMSRAPPAGSQTVGSPIHACMHTYIHIMRCIDMCTYMCIYIYIHMYVYLFPLTCSVFVCKRFVSSFVHINSVKQSIA